MSLLPKPLADDLGTVRPSVTPARILEVFTNRLSEQFTSVDGAIDCVFDPRLDPEDVACHHIHVFLPADIVADTDPDIISAVESAADAIAAACLDGGLTRFARPNLPRGAWLAERIVTPKVSALLWADHDVHQGTVRSRIDVYVAKVAA